MDSSLANHISAMWVIYNGHVFSQEELLLCYAGKAPCRPCCCFGVRPAGPPKETPAGRLTKHNTGGDCFYMCTWESRTGIYEE